MSDHDHADAILVSRSRSLHGYADPRPANSQGRAAQPGEADGRFPASTALDGGAEEGCPLRAEGGRPPSSARWQRALGAEGYDTGAPFEEEAAAIPAKVLRDAPDQTIVWGERLARPGAVEALHACMPRSTCTSGSGPGLLSRSPRESNTRGLREAGCLPRAGPGLEPMDAGRRERGDQDGLAAHELGAMILVNADPVRTHPDSDGRRLSPGASRLDPSFGDDSTTSPTSSSQTPAREGGNRHPS